MNEIDAVRTIVTNVKEALSEISERERREGRLSDKLWTAAVYSRLANQGTQKGYKVFCSGGLNFGYGGGFLYDLCWLQYDREGFLNKAVLILESEWGGEQQIDDDFQKLLLGKADIKVMVFQRNSPQDIKEMFEKMESWIKRFSNPSKGAEVYVLCGWEYVQRQLQGRLVDDKGMVVQLFN